MARAAAVGGGRTYRSQAPRGWFALLLAICLGGVALVAYSSYQRTVPPPAAVKKPQVPPTSSSQWEVALAVDICGKVVANALPTSPASVSAYLTLPNGVVNLEPQRAVKPTQYEGKNATLATYLAAEGITLGSKSLTIPGKPVTSPTTTSTSTTASTPATTSTSTTSTTLAGSTSSSSTGSTTTTTPSPSSTTTTTVPKLGPNRAYVAGTYRCAGQPGEVQVEVWSSPSASKGVLVAPGKAGAIRFRNGQLITLGFVAKGTTLAKPPGAHAVEQFLVSNPLGQAPTPTVPTSPTPTVPTSPTPPPPVSAPSSTSTTTRSSSPTSSSGSPPTTAAGTGATAPKKSSKP